MRVQECAYNLALAVGLDNTRLTLEQIVTTDRIVTSAFDALVMALLGALRTAQHNASNKPQWNSDLQVPWADEGKPAATMPPLPRSKVAPAVPATAS